MNYSLVKKTDFTHFFFFFFFCQKDLRLNFRNFHTVRTEMIPYFSYSKKTVKESKTTGKRRLLKERLLWHPYIPLEMPQIEMMELTRPFPILWDLKMRLTIPALFTRY